MALDNATLNDRAEARLEQLLEQSADIGPAWRQMVDGMQAEAGDLAVDAVSLATRTSVSDMAAHGLSEKFEALAERLEGVGLSDVAAQLQSAAHSIDAGDANSLARASEAALQSSQELAATSEVSKSFDTSMAIATGEASTLAEASSATEDKYGYGYRDNSILDIIDRYREGAGLEPLREVSPLFRDLHEVAKELGEAWKSLNEKETPQVALEGALEKLGDAKADLAAAQERMVAEGDSPAARDAVNGALARFNQAEAEVMGALDQVATELNVPTAQMNAEAVSVAEGTMTQFLEAGGTVTADLARDVESLDSLAGLTVRELNSVEAASLDSESSRDVAGMLDNLATQADSLGLSDMAEGLRDAATATAEGPQSVDLDAVRDFVGESAQTISELRAATEAFSFGEAEFSVDNSRAEVSSDGLVSTEVSMASADFASLFQAGTDALQANEAREGGKEERSASQEMEMGL